MLLVWMLIIAAQEVCVRVGASRAADLAATRSTLAKTQVDAERHSRLTGDGAAPYRKTSTETLLTITHITHTLYNSPPQPRGARRDLSPAEGAAVNLPGAHARAAEHVATDVDHDVLPSLHAHLARRRSARRLQLPLRL